MARMAVDALRLTQTCSGSSRGTRRSTRSSPLPQQQRLAGRKTILSSRRDPRCRPSSEHVAERGDQQRPTGANVSIYAWTPAARTPGSTPARDPPGGRRTATGPTPRGGFSAVSRDEVLARRRRERPGAWTCRGPPPTSRATGGRPDREHERLTPASRGRWGPAGYYELGLRAEEPGVRGVPAHRGEGLRTGRSCRRERYFALPPGEAPRPSPSRWTSSTLRDRAQESPLRQLFRSTEKGACATRSVMEDPARASRSLPTTGRVDGRKFSLSSC